MAKKVFVSYDHRSNKIVCNILCNLRDRFDFLEYNDVATNSNEANTIKHLISKKIKHCTYVLCIIEKYTHKSTLVNWQLHKALQLKKKIVLIKLDNDYEIPTVLRGLDSKLFSISKIDKVIEHQTPKESFKSISRKFQVMTKSSNEYKKMADLAKRVAAQIKQIHQEQHVGREGYVEGDSE